MQQLHPHNCMITNKKIPTVVTNQFIVIRCLNYSKQYCKYCTICHNRIFKYSFCPYSMKQIKIDIFKNNSPLFNIFEPQHVRQTNKHWG